MNPLCHVQNELLLLLLELGQLIYSAVLDVYSSFLPSRQRVTGHKNLTVYDDPTTPDTVGTNQVQEEEQDLENNSGSTQTDLQNTIVALCLQVHRTRKVEDELGHRNKVLDTLLRQRNSDIEQRDRHIGDLQNKLIQSAECLSSVLAANARLVQCLDETNQRAAGAEHREREWRRQAQRAVVALEERANVPAVSTNIDQQERSLLPVSDIHKPERVRSFRPSRRT